MGIRPEAKPRQSARKGHALRRKNSGTRDEQSQGTQSETADRSSVLEARYLTADGKGGLVLRTNPSS